MKIITVSGASSGVGKTGVAALLLKNLPNWASIKITVCYDFPCPKRKACRICQNPPKTFSIITNPKIINQKNKDTYYLSQATQGPVLWIKTRPEFILKAFEEALKLIKKTKDEGRRTKELQLGQDSLDNHEPRATNHKSRNTNYPGILIESTSILKYIKPDFTLFVTRPEIADFTPSALQIINKINLFVINNSNNAPPSTIQNHIKHLQTLNPNAPIFVLNSNNRQSQKNLLDQIISIHSLK